jgi:hypothetical protein
MDTIPIHRILCFILLFICQKVSAFDAGDTIALLLGLAIGIIGIFACLGCYARRKGGN